MSAFILENAHIDALVDVAKQFCPALVAGPATPTEVGRMLLGENAASVATLYDEPQEPAALLYEYRPTNRTFTRGEAANVVACYAYQTCEHGRWATSAAHELVRALEAVIGDVEPAGPWAWSDADLGRLEGAR